MKLVFLFFVTFLAVAFAEDDLVVEIVSGDAMVLSEPSDALMVESSEQVKLIPKECEMWSTELEDLGRCCYAPTHENYVYQSICQSLCTVNGHTDYKCFISCYLDRTGLLKNGKIDKAVIKKMYEDNYYNYEWNGIIEAAIAKCEFEPTGETTEDVTKYFKCLNDHLVMNCINFQETVECEPTQNRFEICHDIKFNCTYWPPNVELYEGCCLTPTLTSDDIEKCKADCPQKEIFSFRQQECVQNCTWTDTGIVTSEGAIDFVRVKDVLTENANKSENWGSAIEIAVTTCEKNLKGKLKDTKFPNQR